MNPAMQELYQQTILEHNRKPRNFGKLDKHTHYAEGFNPVCGDHLHVYLQINDQNKIDDLKFEGSGCAISKASASLMTTSLKGKNSDDAEKMFDEFHALLKGDLKPDKDSHNLGKLSVFSGIWQYPARVKCASLSWHTMKNALHNIKIAKTE